MRLIDADALYDRFWERGWYDNADRDECACVDVDNAPTVAAVPVSALRTLWDDLYANELISIEGLRQFKALIDMHTGGGADG